MPQTNDVIVKAAALNKFLDFRDNLNPANQEDYAMLHGIGGKNHAMTSTITALITDYSAGTGEASKSVKANLPPHIFDAIKATCEANMMVRSVPVEGFWGSVINASVLAGMAYDKIETLVRAFPHFLKGVVGIAAAKVKGSDEKTAWTSLGSGAKRSGEESVKEGKSDIGIKLLDTGCMSLPVFCDYFYTQTRVNSYRPAQDGRVPVSICSIVRESRKKGGAQASLPWTVSIRNFMALPRTAKNGTTAYDSNSVTNKTEAFISLSDMDMHRCCFAVIHYISVFENVVCGASVRKGLEMRKQEREAWRTQRQGPANNQPRQVQQQQLQSQTRSQSRTQPQPQQQQQPRQQQANPQGKQQYQNRPAPAPQNNRGQYTQRPPQSPPPNPPQSNTNQYVATGGGSYADSDFEDDIPF